MLRCDGSLQDDHARVESADCGAEPPQLREMEGGMGYRNFMNGEVNELWMGRL